MKKNNKVRVSINDVDVLRSLVESIISLTPGLSSAKNYSDFARMLGVDDNIITEIVKTIDLESGDSIEFVITSPKDSCEDGKKQKIQKKNLKSGSIAGYTPEQVRDQILLLKKHNMAIEKIAQMIGVTQFTVYKWCKMEVGSVRGDNSKNAISILMTINPGSGTLSHTSCKCHHTTIKA